MNTSTFSSVLSAMRGQSVRNTTFGGLFPVIVRCVLMMILMGKWVGRTIMVRVVAVAVAAAAIDDGDDDMMP